MLTVLFVVKIFVGDFSGRYDRRILSTQVLAFERTEEMCRRAI
jgi:hypothetical protein